MAVNRGRKCPERTPYVKQIRLGLVLDDRLPVFGLDIRRADADPKLIANGGRTGRVRRSGYQLRPGVSLRPAEHLEDVGGDLLTQGGRAVRVQVYTVYRKQLDRKSDV